MKFNKKTLLLLGFMISIFSIQAQNHKFYIRANNANFNPSITTSKGVVTYTGNNIGLKKVFDNNTIYVFRNAFAGAHSSILQRTWYVEGDSANLLNDFLQFASSTIEFGEIIEEPTLANTYPNDYGVTGPAGTNQGIPADLGYFDFIGVPQAWDYTTGNTSGNPKIRVGISDGGITDDDDDFIDQIIPNGVLSTTNHSPHISHGNTVSMILAGEGDNTYGSTGITQDCEIITHYFSNNQHDIGSDLSSYERLLELAQNGAKIINCSWAGFYNSTDQECINEITGPNYNAIVIAAAGNDNSEIPRYPASYDNVISVGAVGSGKDFTYDNIDPPPAGGTFYTIKNLKHALGGNVAFLGNAPTPENFQETAYIIGGRARMNDKVDIMAPGGSIFRYGAYLDNEGILYTSDQTLFTSPATPMVSGTIALMLDLNQCLNLIEVESIIKASSTYIAEFNFNRNHTGNFVYDNRHGSGTLHVGRAVKLTNNLLDPNEIAYIENQKFTRWDFRFKGVSERIEIRNQEFTESSTLEVIAKNLITIEESSTIEPNIDGYTLLEIDPNLTIPTNCALRNIAINPSKNSEDDATPTLYKVYPTKVTSNISIEKIENGISHLESIKIYDLFNREVFSQNELQGNKLDFDLSGLKRGIYIVKGYSESKEVILTEKIIKD